MKIQRSALAASLLLAWIVSAGPAPAIAERAADTGALHAIIDDYVREGLTSNLALQGAGLEIEKTEAALAAARARFLPEAVLLGRYTRAEGGREISLPLSAAFNPVYATLNELLIDSGRPARFGMIEDPRFLLQREREQDTRLSIRQPLFAPALPAALRAARANLSASEFARQSLAQSLRRDITIGYLQWLQLEQALRVLTASQALLDENLRVTRSLFANGVITRDQVLRAEAESLALNQQQIEAQANARQLRAYVNFLLNRALDASLVTADANTATREVTEDLEALRDTALSQRPELAELRSATTAVQAQRDLARAQRLPTIALAVDGGSQGERYEFGRGNNYATLSLLLNWTLFDGGARSAEERVARLTERQFGLRQEQLRQTIALEVQQALDTLLASEAATRTGTARTAAAQAAFTIAARKRDAGVISQVEFLDARTTLTSAELELNRLRFAVLIRQAELDHVVGRPVPGYF